MNAAFAHWKACSLKKFFRLRSLKASYPLVSLTFRAGYAVKTFGGCFGVCPLALFSSRVVKGSIRLVWRDTLLRGHERVGLWQMVREAGYEAACSTKAGGVRTGSDPFALPRLHVGNWPGHQLARYLGP